MKFGYICTYLILLMLGIVGCQQSREHIKKGLSPKEALSTFELRPGFNIQLVASEPLISDPVDMMIDEKGDLYVVEMHGYNLGKKSSGTVKRLRDTNGDGQMDKKTIFADSLRLPTGIMSWKEGFLVTAPPDVWYLIDKDEDGRADNKKKILTGFDTSNAEANVNNPVYGLDNGIYMANMIASKNDIFYSSQHSGPRLPKGANGQDVRFRPDSHSLKMLSGRSQFGQTFDRWGNRFLVSSTRPIYQEVIANRYLQRNKDLLVSNATQSLTNSRNVSPITRNPQNQLLTDVGTFTAAGGITAYEGAMFPAAFDSSVFVTESAHNLVRGFRLIEDGPSFGAKPFRKNKEFLASTDAWFRPVNIYNGPDGALYVVDYYREIIEGRAWLSEEVRESGKIPNGSQQGRIYRITTDETKSATWTKNLNLEEATNTTLIKKLADPNIWWRRNAQRVLVDRADDSDVPFLEEMSRQSSSAVGRLHALWTLEGMGKLKPTIIRNALKDSIAGIRENAIKLAELHLDSIPSLLEPLFTMQSDPNAKVRFQLLATLGFADTPRAAQVRQKLLFENIDNKWTQIAALSALASQNSELLRTIVRRFKPSYSSLVQRLSAIQVANKEPNLVHMMIKRATGSASEEVEGWQAPMLDGVAEGLGNRQKLYSSVKQDEFRLIETFFENPSAQVRQGCLKILKVIGLSEGSKTRDALLRASNIAEKQNLSTKRRVEALHFIMLADPSPYASLLKELIISQEPTSLQVAAVQSLSDIPGNMISQFVLKHWSTMKPGVQDAALATFLVRPFEINRIKLLLDAISEDKIQSTSLSWPQKVTLMRDIPDSLKEKARSLLARNKNVDEYVKAVKQKTGKFEEGRMIYLQNCAVCHHVGNTSGVGFGPNLRTVRNWKSSAIIEKIVNPNKSIAEGYSLWRLEFENGKVKQGVISNKTSNAVTLRNQQGEETTFSRQNISSLKSLQVSPMPTDLKDKINPQEMANLVSFIQSTK